MSANQFNTLPYRSAPAPSTYRSTPAPSTMSQDPHLQADDIEGLIRLCRDNAAFLYAMRPGFRDDLNLVSWKADGLKRVALIGQIECNQVGRQPLSHSFYTYGVGESRMSEYLAIRVMLEDLQARVATFAPTIVAYGDAKVLQIDATEEEKAWIAGKSQGKIDIMTNMVVAQDGLTLANVQIPGFKDEDDESML